MSADTLRIMAIVLAVLTVLLFLLAFILYKAFRIREVRDELTGRTAQRQIEQMRGVRGKIWRGNAEQSEKEIEKMFGSDSQTDDSDVRLRSVSNGAGLERNGDPEHTNLLEHLTQTQKTADSSKAASEDLTESETHILSVPKLGEDSPTENETHLLQPKENH